MLKTFEYYLPDEKKLSSHNTKQIPNHTSLTFAKKKF